jgi:aurora kinase
MADVANLEAAFERTTINDENDDQVSSNATYHKAKVCITRLSMRVCF